MKRFAPAIIAIIGGVLLLVPTSDSTSDTTSAVGEALANSHAADRASQVAILRDAATMPAVTSDDLRAIVVAVNDRRAAAHTTDWMPYTEMLAEAIDAGTLDQMVVGDVLATCHAADRASQAAILRDAATMPAETAADRRAIVVAVNDRRAAARRTDWVPYTDMLAEAIDAGTLVQMADKLEASQ